MPLLLRPLVPKRRHVAYPVPYWQGASQPSGKAIFGTFISLCPPTLLLCNEDKYIRARTTFQPYWGSDAPVSEVCEDS